MSAAEFINAMYPHAVAAIGVSHPWLIEWAIAKAGVECGWATDNVLIIEAQNCLGVKAEIDGQPIPGVPSLILRANTGPEAGRPVYWRKFDSLKACFGEFCNQVNWRGSYDSFRDSAVMSFEKIYTDGLQGHAQQVLKAIENVQEKLRTIGVIDERGRMVGNI